MAKKIKKVSVSEYVNVHNPRLTRRGKKMSESYIYRLIRNNQKGLPHPTLWFEYTLEGEKDHVFIII